MVIEMNTKTIWKDLWEKEKAKGNLNLTNLVKGTTGVKPIPFNLWVCKKMEEQRPKARVGK